MCENNYFNIPNAARSRQQNIVEIFNAKKIMERQRKE